MESRRLVTLECDLDQLRAMIESGHGDTATFGERLVGVLFGGEHSIDAIALALYGVRLSSVAAVEPDPDPDAAA